MAGERIEYARCERIFDHVRGTHYGVWLRRATLVDALEAHLLSTDVHDCAAVMLCRHQHQHHIARIKSRICIAELETKKRRQIPDLFILFHALAFWLPRSCSSVST